MIVPKWDDSYCIGLPVFDSEHKSILGMMEHICLACEQDADRQGVVAQLDDLLDLFLRHIAWEERWMGKLTTPAGVDHRNRHKSGHHELAARAMLMRERLSIGGDCRAAFEDFCFFVTLFELIQFDFELVGLLRREGILTGANHELLGGVLPDPLRIGAGTLIPPHSPTRPEPSAEQPAPGPKPA
ncbi:MAG: hemerythrin domain-containing protein [Rhodospirillales bacterium]|nr:hemerythrin domain-containing protein [Rhodospirillales bacterium]